MWASSFLLALLICQIQSGSFCPCNGVVIPGSDQEHCWEVVSGGSRGGWVAGDVACQVIGGHLGHLNTVLTTLIPYLRKMYTRPILTGIVAGNADTQRYSMVCPNNVYYGQLNSTMTSALLAQNATSSPSCAFVTSADYKVHFAPCSTAADALCDRPMEKADYCSIKMNCTSTTTGTTSTTGSSVSTTTSSTNSSTRSTSLSTSSIASLITNTTSPTTTSSTSPPAGSTSSSRLTSAVTTSSPIAPTTVKMISTVSSLLTGTTLKSQCPTVEDCDWKIFGSCGPWFPWLALALLLLGILGWLCWCCAFCCGKKERNQIDNTEAGMLSPRVHSAPPAITGRTAVSYSPEPTMHNPPVVVESPPIVMVPFKMSPGPVRTVEKFTKEIHVVEKEKVILKDVGVNTDLWTPTLEVAPKARRPFPTPIEIQDDPADDVSIDMPFTPGLDDGDFNFVRNTRPDGFGDVPLGDVPPKQADPQDPATVINLTADPRNIRSPPSKQRNVHLPTDDVRSFSPISDVSEDALPLSKPGQRFQPPPTRKPKIPENIPSTNSPQVTPEERNSPPGSESGYGTLTTFSVLLRNNTDTPPANEPNGKRNLAPPSNGRRPSRNSNGNAMDPRDPSPNNNRNRTPYGGGERSRGNSTSPGPVPLMKPADVSIRAAHGKLGGVVRGGGGPDDQAPQEWKPWAKTSKGFHPGQ